MELIRKGMLILCLILPTGLIAQVPLQELLDEGFQCQWEPYREVGVLKKGGLRIHFSPRWPWLVANLREKIYEGEPVIRRRGQILFSSSAAEVLRRWAALHGGTSPSSTGGRDSDENRDPPREPASPPEQGAHRSFAAIMIDPGHGGRDPGTLKSWETEEGNFTLYEKDIVLACSLQLAEALRRTYPDKEILLTRDDDTYPTLKDRTDMANALHLEEDEAMLFISIHANASFNPEARGFEIWYLPQDFRRRVLAPEESEGKPEKVLPVLNRLLEEEFARESRNLAEEILLSMDEAVGHLTENRGTKEESWYVVRNARMPAVLLELGFVTNKEEARLLSQEDYLKKITRGVYNGVVRFLNDYESP